MVGECLVTAGLESGGIAAQRRVEVVNRCEDTVCVLSSTSIVDINCEICEQRAWSCAKTKWAIRTVGINIFARGNPVGLQEAKGLGCDSGIVIS